MPSVYQTRVNHKLQIVQEAVEWFKALACTPTELCSQYMEASLSMRGGGTIPRPLNLEDGAPQIFQMLRTPGSELNLVGSPTIACIMERRTCAQVGMRGSGGHRLALFKDGVGARRGVR